MFAYHFNGLGPGMALARILLASLAAFVLLIGLNTLAERLARTREYHGGVSPGTLPQNLLQLKLRRSIQRIRLLRAVQRNASVRAAILEDYQLLRHEIYLQITCNYSPAARTTDTL